MRTQIIRLFGAALFVSAAACGGAPDDFEGASNTDPQTVPNACGRLANCCYALGDEERGSCITTSNSADEAECTTTLQGVGAICQ